MPKFIGKYQIKRSLGEGGTCKVKSAYDSESGEKVAVKILNQNMGAEMNRIVMEEVATMKNFSHPNIINLLDYGHAEYGEGSGKMVDYIVLEIAEKACIFDYVSQTGPLSENFARYYFTQLMTGLQYAHKKGFAHRDIKPENILIDKDYNLKVADFGFAGPSLGRDGKGYLFTQLGTRPYMAPEIHLNQPYTGEAVDLFASAIVLFILVSGHPPFNAAIAKDPYYKALAKEQFEMFWNAHSKTKPTGNDFFTAEFKDLLN